MRNQFLRQTSSSGGENAERYYLFFHTEYIFSYCRYYIAVT